MAKYATPRGGVTENRTLKHAHSAALEATEVLVINGQVTVAVNDSAANADNVFIFAGPVEFDKEAGLAINAGDVVYWDDTAKEIDKTNTNVKAGICKEAAAAGDATVLVELMPNA